MSWRGWVVDCPSQLAFFGRFFLQKWGWDLFAIGGVFSKTLPAICVLLGGQWSSLFIIWACRLSLQCHFVIALPQLKHGMSRSIAPTSLSEFLHFLPSSRRWTASHVLEPLGKVPREHSCSLARQSQIAVIWSYFEDILLQFVIHAFQIDKWH